jgi:hypothetical protein
MRREEKRIRARIKMLEGLNGSWAVGYREALEWTLNKRGIPD